MCSPPCGASGSMFSEGNNHEGRMGEPNATTPTPKNPPSSVNPAPSPPLVLPAETYPDPGASVGAEMAAAEWHYLPPASDTHSGHPSGHGGSRELLKLALPLILSQSFMTVQVFVDTLLLSWHNPLEMAASFPAVMWYWLFFGVLQVTAGYTST